VLDRVAYDAGVALGAVAGDVHTALDEAGYEPRVEREGGGLRLVNCPFHRLAQQFTELVCGVNLQLLRGVAHGAGDISRTPVLAPSPGQCCVRLPPTPT
jgi:predicted ArsR family transcriptional regulator